MIAPKLCACGTWMHWREARPPSTLRPDSGVYLCHHCDAACAGVASNVRCALCARMAVKRS